jgi:hypothetical protein
MLSFSFKTLFLLGFHDNIWIHFSASGYLKIVTDGRVCDDTTENENQFICERH